MTNSMVFKVACLAMMCLVLGLPLTNAAITCSQVENMVAPCIAYITGSGGVVPEPCCKGIKALKSESNTTPDRQAVCRCIKTASESLPGLNLGKVAGLPEKCGVDLPYKLDPSIDCNKIQRPA